MSRRVLVLGWLPTGTLIHPDGDANADDEIKAVCRLEPPQIPEVNLKPPEPPKQTGWPVHGPWDKSSRRRRHK